MKQLFSVIVLIVLSAFAAGANLAAPLLADLDVEYTYDRNGNMTGDANKGMEMSWDYNNRLYKVEDDEMTMTFNRTGSGQKLGKSVYVGPKPKYPLRPGVSRSNSLGGYPAFPRDSVLVYPTDSIFHIGNTTLTEYFGAYEYINGKFAQLNTSTGYRDSEGMHVYVHDWQGNIRAVVRKGDDGSTVLEQATYYYPYGMPMAESTNPTANRYKYTGKELLTDKGINIYDYIARAYDPATCRWWSVDEHSADYAPMSHYSMCAGDPINHIDPNGKDVYILSSSGHFDLKMKTTDNYDLIKVENSKETITISKDFMVSQKTETGVSGGMSVSVDYYYTNSPNEDYFKFFAGNTDVEWSRIEFSDGSSVIGTAHEHNSEGTPGVVLLVFKDILNMITKFDHTHTSGNVQPSPADVDMAKKYEQFAPNIVCRIFWNYDFNKSAVYDGTTNAKKPQELEEIVVLGVSKKR